MKITIKKLEKSELEITGVLEAKIFETFETKALEKISKRLELPGFRKGKAPANIVKEKTSEMEILEEMAEQALAENYIKILEENKIDAIGRPQVSITKIARGADLEFKILTAVLPDMKLPDYKKIAKKENSKEEYKKEIIIENKELEKVINDLRKMRAEQVRNAEKVKEVKKSKAKNDELIKDRKKAKPDETESLDDSKKGTKEQEKPEEIKESDYPPFDDDFAKSFGKFKTADELRDKIKSNLLKEKETEQKDKLRLSIVEELVKLTEGEIPEILIQSETDKILYKLKADISNTGFKYEDYLKQINKTEDDLKKEWRDDSLKRAKLQMIIHSISKKESLKPTEEEIEKDVVGITEMYKDADPARARAYVEQMLVNEKVFAFLEKE